MVCLKGTVNNMAKVGKNIRVQRTKQGISQETLAEQLYVSRQTVSNYETGKSYPDIDMLVKIAEVLKVDISVLIYGEAVLKQRPVFDRKYLKADVIASAATYLVSWIIVWCMQLSNDWSPWENLVFNLIFSGCLVGLHIFVHWLIGVYEKRYHVKEEIVYAGLANILEYVLGIFAIRDLRFIEGLFYFPEFYVPIFFGTMILVEIGITLIRYRSCKNI